MVTRLVPAKIVSVAAGKTHSLAVASDGRVFTFGSALHGCLGSPLPTSVVIPHQLSYVGQVVAAAAGLHSSLVLTREGEVHKFGSFAGRDFVHPTKVDFPSGVKIRQISAGSSHWLCASEAGHVYSFGTNYEGRLGLGPGSELYQHKPKWVHLPAGEFATAVSASEHSLVLTRTGGVYAFGPNLQGQLGIGSHDFGSHPTQVTTYEVIEDDGQDATSKQRPVIVRVSAGQSYSLMVDDQGRVFFAGRFRLQRVPALPKEKSIMLTPIPRQLTLAPLDDARPHGDVEQPARIVEVSTSPFHFMLLTADGRAISVGRICPAPTSSSSQQRVWQLPLGMHARAVCAGPSHAFILL